PLPYQVLCLVSVVAIYLVDLRHGYHLAGLLVPLVGLLGILSKLRVAPLLLLAVLAAAHVVRGFSFRQFEMPWRPLQLEDVALCAAVLAYVAGHYRLQGLEVHLLPLDPRHSSRWGRLIGGLPRKIDRRAGHLATPVEL